MNDSIPEKLPACAVSMLARAEWYSPDPGVVSRARLAKANWLARFLSNPFFSHAEIWAITLGNTIYIRMEEAYNPHTAIGLALLAHELKHVQQYERNGVLRFFVRYISSYGSHGGYGRSVDFENEAYALGDDVREHLTKEFANNPGKTNCVELGNPHTPNAAFIKAIPELFRFPKAENNV